MLKLYYQNDSNFSWLIESIQTYRKNETIKYEINNKKKKQITIKLFLHLHWIGTDLMINNTNKTIFIINLISIDEFNNSSI